MNKKSIIKQYEEVAKNNLDIQNNEIANSIRKKAKFYNITLFEDEVLASKLLDAKNVQELSKEGLIQITKITKSMIDIEEKAQLSKTT